MADISLAAQAKSNQLNAVDIMGCEPVITIREVNVRQGDQPVAVFYHGDNNRPWYPSKGMIRILMAGWGKESDNWVGKSVQIFMEPSVTFGGKAVGGIRVRAMSDIPQRGINATLTINRTKREPYPVQYLDMKRPEYPEDKFNAGFDAMAAAMESKQMTLQQVIGRCQQTGDLTESQLQRLTEAAPIEIDEED